MADLAQFDLGSAQRIARVVRAVEQEPQRAKPLTFGPVFDAKKQKAFRVCTFNGSWPIGSSKTVTFKNQTTTPNTVSATNLFWPIPDGSQRDCSIAKDGTAWYLLVPQLYADDAVTDATINEDGLKFSTLPMISLATSSTVNFTVIPNTVTIVTGGGLDSGKLVLNRQTIGVFFEDTATSVEIYPKTIDAITNVTLGSDSLSFTRNSIGVFFESTAETVAISVTTCSTAAV
jgi:hypothetical protein